MVDLGELYINGPPAAQMIAVVVNVAQAVTEVDQAKRLAQAVQVEQVEEALKAGVVETLGSGPPFGTTEDKAASLLSLEVDQWGLSVPYIGAPGVFLFSVKVRIYKPDGDRVYSARTQCESGVGSPPVVQQVLGLVDNVEELEKLSDQQINEAFVAMAQWCGQEIVLKMREHAG
jgi:hypothetical protein